jgi:hypothetical protein
MKAMKKKTPSQRVEAHLAALGYVVLGDITFVHGGAHKRLNDTIECWTAYVRDPKNLAKELEVKSAHTLSECQKGIRLLPNSQKSDLYGDLIAEPFTLESQIGELKHQISKKDSALRKAKHALTWAHPYGGNSCAGEVTFQQSEQWIEEASEAIDAAL